MRCEIMQRSKCSCIEYNKKTDALPLSSSSTLSSSTTPSSSSSSADKDASSSTGASTACSGCKKNKHTQSKSKEAKKQGCKQANLPMSGCTTGMFRSSHASTSSSSGAFMSSPAIVVSVLLLHVVLVLLQAFKWSSLVRRGGQRTRARSEKNWRGSKRASLKRRKNGRHDAKLARPSELQK